MVRAKIGTTDLETTRESLASWRRQYGGRGIRIPVAFWDRARELARVHGVAETARALQLNEGRLAGMVEQAPVAIAPREVEPGAFVELGGLGVDVRDDTAVLEFARREGDCLRVQVAASAVDVVALASAFWGRQP
jgi:hypothetical protein